MQWFAVTASREGKLPYPDGSIVAWIVWTYHPLESLRPSAILCVHPIASPTTHCLVPDIQPPFFQCVVHLFYAPALPD